MAQPIPMPAAPLAPATSEERHADAIASGLALLQTLHDRGVLDLLRGLAGAGDQLTGMAAAAASAPDAQRAIQNFILLTRFFATIPPEVLKSLVETVERGAQRKKDERAPTLLQLLRRMRSEESRHALAVTLDLLESVGKGL